MECQICGSETGCAIFKNDPWCSNNCREKYEEQEAHPVYSVRIGQ